MCIGAATMSYAGTHNSANRRGSGVGGCDGWSHFVHASGGCACCACRALNSGSLELPRWAGDGRYKYGLFRAAAGMTASQPPAMLEGSKNNGNWDGRVPSMRWQVKDSFSFCLSPNCTRYLGNGAGMRSLSYLDTRGLRGWLFSPCKYRIQYVLATWL